MTTFYLRTAGRLVRIAQSTDKEALFDDISKEHPAKDLNAKSNQNFLGRGLNDIVFKVKRRGCYEKTCPRIAEHSIRGLTL